MTKTMTDTTVSARSKVMSNWSSSYIASEAPDVQPVTRHQSMANRSNAQRTNRLSTDKSANSVDTDIKDTKVYTKLRDKTIKCDANDKSSVTTKRSNRSTIQESVETPVVSGGHKDRHNDSPDVISSRLRRHSNNLVPNGHKSQSIGAKQDTKNDDKPVIKCETKDTKCKDNGRKDGPKVADESDAKSVTIEDMDYEDNGQTSVCVADGCNGPIRSCPLFEAKFCSSVCAVRQWTEDFHNTWGHKKKPKKS